MEIKRLDFKGNGGDRFSLFTVDTTGRIEITATSIRVSGYFDLPQQRFSEMVAVMAKAHALSRWYALAPAEAEVPTDELLDSLTRQIHMDKAPAP